MYITETQIRIHYALTDQMGVVYHGHYAQFYEIGRGEAIRNLGYTYKDIEALGIIMPVVDVHSRFFRPAKYDDLITVKTTLKELPLHHKIVFHSEIFNEFFRNSGTINTINLGLKIIDPTCYFFMGYSLQLLYKYFF